MAHGFMGKILFVNLSNGEITEEKLEEKVYREYLGGYGLGAKIIYDRQKGGVDRDQESEIKTFRYRLPGAPSGE